MSCGWLTLFAMANHPKPSYPVKLRPVQAGIPHSNGTRLTVHFYAVNAATDYGTYPPAPETQIQPEKRNQSRERALLAKLGQLPGIQCTRLRRRAIRVASTQEATPALLPTANTTGCALHRGNRPRRDNDSPCSYIGFFWVAQSVLRHFVVDGCHLVFYHSLCSCAGGASDGFRRIL